MDELEKRRQQILGKSYKPLSNQSAFSGSQPSTFQQRRQQVLQQSIRPKQTQQSVQQPVQQKQPQQNFLQKAESFGSNIIKGVKDYFTGEVQKGSTLVSDIQQGSGVNKTISDIPFLGGLVSNEQQLGRDIGESVTLNSVKSKIAQSKDPASIVREIAMYNKTTDPKKKKVLWQFISGDLGIHSSIFGPPDTIPLNSKTAAQYGADVAGVALDVATALTGGGSKFVEKPATSFLEKLLEKKTLAIGAGIGAAYGAQQSVAGGETNIYNILQNAGKTAILFPAVEATGGVLGKIASLISNQFSKRIITYLSNSATQEQAAKKITTVTDQAVKIAKGDKQVLQGLRNPLQKEIDSYRPEDFTNPETQKYLGALQQSIDRIDKELGAREDYRGTSFTQEGAIKYVDNNFDSMKSSYNQKATQLYGSDNVVSADVAKEAIPGYVGTNANTYHEGSSTFANKLYTQLLDERQGTANNTVLFSSGGTGSGKTTALEDAGVLTKDYSVVYDTNLSGEESSAKKIQAALDKGYNVKIMYVQRDPVKAFEEGVIPRTSRTGRIVSMSEHINRHEQAFSTLEKLKQKYGNKIEVGYIDNTGGKGQAKEVPFENLPKFSYNKEELKGQLDQILSKYERSGQITKEQATAIRKDMAQPIRGQSEPQQQKTTEPATQKTSKVAASISQKSIADKIVTDFKDVASYTPKTVEDQSKRVSDFITNNIDEAKSVVRGETSVPEGMSSSMFIKGMEEYAMQTKDAQLIRDLVSSPLASETSVHAQELRFLAERDQYSPLSVMKQLEKDRAKTVQNKLKNLKSKSMKQATDIITSNIKNRINENLPGKNEWALFIDSIQC